MRKKVRKERRKGLLSDDFFIESHCILSVDFVIVFDDEKLQKCIVDESIAEPHCRAELEELEERGERERNERMNERRNEIKKEITFLRKWQVLSRFFIV